MNTDKEAWLNALFEKSAFTNLGKERAALFRGFAEDIGGKSPMETALRYVKLNSQLKKEQRLTAEEQNAVAEAIKESLSEEDRRKFTLILKMIAFRM